MDVIERLSSVGAVYTNSHFIYTSGKHGHTYINMDPILPDVRLMAELCAELAEPFRGEVDAVAAPAVGAIVLAVLTAQALSGTGVAVPAVWADKTGSGDFAIERSGFAELVTGRRVLVVEDLVTTGVSVAKVCDELRRHDARIMGVAAVCNRGGVTAADLDVPRLFTLTSVSFASYPAESCPLCAENRPIVEDIGHGSDYRSLRPDYPGGFIKAGAGAL